MSDLSNVQPESRSETLMASPDKVVKVRDLFGIDSDMEVPAFSEADERVRQRVVHAHAGAFNRLVLRRRHGPQTNKQA